MSNNTNRNQPNVVPFGKYKGQPIEVLAADPKYVEWLNGQGWVKDRHPQFYTVIINNFQEPSDTPEHNALQALFLDDALCMRFLSTVADMTARRDHFRQLKSKKFEVGGVDVLLSYDRWPPGIQFKAKGQDVKPEKMPSLVVYFLKCGIEIKPSIGDDFPAVLRQAQNMRNVDQKCVLFRDFVATSVTFDQVRSMFSTSGVMIFSLDEVNQAEPDMSADEWERANLEEGEEDDAI